MNETTESNIRIGLLVLVAGAYLYYVWDARKRGIEFEKKLLEIPEPAPKAHPPMAALTTQKRRTKHETQERKRNIK